MTADIAEHVPSYPSIFAVGHRVLANFFDDHVVVEEKIDGSQFSFGVLNGTLCARSKNRTIDLDNADKLFGKAVETIRTLAPILQPGYLYRGEYLSKPRHNALAYDRVPAMHVVIYDIEDVECGGSPSSQVFLSASQKEVEAERIGLECVKTLYEGYVNSPDTLKRLVPQVSMLGGKAEGVVVKNYNRYGPDKKILLAKFVTDDFKEVHRGTWAEAKAKDRQGDVAERIASQYNGEARRRKAVQHLRDRGELTQSPKDIGPLMKEMAQDVEKECADEIKEQLYKTFWPQISRAISKVIPAWYKDFLVAVEQTYASQPHADCGRGDENGPFHSDCGCRTTPDALICAAAGCGFCGLDAEQAAYDMPVQTGSGEVLS